MHARAHLAVERSAGPPGRGRTRIARLRSDGPVVLRPTIATGSQEPLRRWDLSASDPVRITRTAGAAGPLGGDRIRLDVEVGPGAALVLREASASLVLPGPHGKRSTSRTRVRVGAGATVVWLPEPVIAVRGCDHHATTEVVLEEGARLLLREELLLGRHAEPPGAVRQRLRVRYEDQAVYDQELAVGPGVPGWRGPAVTAGRRALGSLVLVDARWGTEPAPAPVVLGRDLAVLPLPGPAVLVTALAGDGLGLRRALCTGLAHLETAAVTALEQTRSSQATASERQPVHASS